MFTRHHRVHSPSSCSLAIIVFTHHHRVHSPLSCSLTIIVLHHLYLYHLYLFTTTLKRVFIDDEPMSWKWSFISVNVASHTRPFWRHATFSKSEPSLTLNVLWMVSRLIPYHASAIHSITRSNAGALVFHWVYMFAYHTPSTHRNSVQLFISLLSSNIRPHLVITHLFHREQRQVQGWFSLTPLLLH